eukprot:Hpha_TRINITY_DN35340_c0_g1::TRINITY_DN35340_c0_g1_i1::g.85196::m.85196
MGCGASSANWEKRFDEKEGSMKNRRPQGPPGAISEVQVPSIPQVPQLGKCPRLIISLGGIGLPLFDISTDFALLAGFDVGSFPFIFSLVTLVAGPQVLTVYEIKNDVGAKPFSNFHWSLGLINTLHLRSPYQSCVTCLEGRGEAARVRALQVKMILSLTVALPQTVLQGGLLLHDQDDLGFLVVASLVTSIITQAAAMAEFTLRDEDGIQKRVLHTLFATAWMSALFINISYLFSASPVSGAIMAPSVFLVNLVLMSIFVQIWPEISASKKALTLATDAGLYWIGFVDVNFPNPTPDFIFLVVTLAESLLYFLLPHFTGVGDPDAAVTDFVMYFNIGAYCCCFVLLLLIRCTRKQPPRVPPPPPKPREPAPKPQPAPALEKDRGEAPVPTPVAPRPLSCAPHPQSVDSSSQEPCPPRSHHPRPGWVNP